VIGKGVNHVVGTGRKACVRYVPEILGGPGRNRTTDTRIFKPDRWDFFRSSIIWFSHHV